MSTVRIAYARIAQETHCLSPVLTTLDDFRRQHFVEGEALARAAGRFGDEAPGFLRSAELTGFLRAVRDHGRGRVEPVPLFSAWAVPGGPLDEATFARLAGMLGERLRAAGRLDGVFLSLHGAMGARGVRDPDTALLRAAREAIGPGVPIAASLDLHANLTAGRVAGAEILRAYHTNPHRDHAATGFRAGRALLRTLLDGARPVSAWRSLPMILGGGTTVDLFAPMRGVFRRLAAIERDPKVLAASAFMCHPWNDDPALGWSAHVTADGDRDLAERLADELAERLWAVRHEQPPAFATAAEAIRTAREARIARKLGVVCFADASDVVSAGATGESTRLLEALLAGAGDLVSYVPLRDPAVVAELWARAAGERVTVRVGGKLDPARNAPLEVTGDVRGHHARAGFGRMVVLDLGAVKLVLTEGPALAIKPSFYGDVGLSVLAADVVVVKNFFPFRIFFLPYARKTIYVRTGGLTDLDSAYGLDFDGPVFPRDDVQEWRSTDARRRAAT